MGDVDAMCNLGMCFATGEGVAKDDKKAMEWYQRAAELGDAAAMEILGSLFEMRVEAEDKDKEEAVKWHFKAADAGNAAAMSS